MKNITRRLFFKVGCACMAVMPLSIHGIANSHENVGENDAFRVMTNNGNPIMPSDFVIKFKGKDGNIEVNKYDKNGRKIKRSLVVNGRAATILQFCRGHLSSQKIVELYSKVYNEDPEKNSESVLNYIKFLFDNGFIVFAASGFLSEEELVTGKGITVPKDELPFIFVYSETDKKLNRAF